MITDELKALQEGDLVWFQYRQQSGNGRWYTHESTAVFLARRTDQYVDELIISYRPLGGTSSINVLGLDSARVIKTAGERIGMRGDNGAKLPVRHPGAVAPPVQA
jgi:hypothetical protein